MPGGRIPDLFLYCKLANGCTQNAELHRIYSLIIRVKMFFHFSSDRNWLWQCNSSIPNPFKVLYGAGQWWHFLQQPWLSCWEQALVLPTGSCRCAAPSLVLEQTFLLPKSYSAQWSGPSEIVIFLPIRLLHPVSTKKLKSMAGGRERGIFFQTG